ncbi:MAG: tail-specific protease [Gammaproteobacteria bacterium]|nr:MAG: tail-specific protease [Gammaproteobacteria bacterium]
MRILIAIIRTSLRAVVTTVALSVSLPAAQAPAWLPAGTAQALAKSTDTLAPPEALRPSADMRRAAQELTRQLEYGHYRNMRVDDALSEKLLDNYLKWLDPQKQYFLEEDIQSFEPWRRLLDNMLVTGDLDAGFEIYNRYQQRVAERLNFMLAKLRDGNWQPDFNRNETLELDREKAPWAASRAELDDLWRKRLKNAMLSQLLDGKQDKDIRQSLIRRYETQLKRLSQTRPEDAFQAYMNALTSLYDPHTTYFSPRVTENFNINMSLSLEGIGAVLQSDNEFTKVVRLVPGGPAQKAGTLKPTDRIVGVGQGDGEIQNVIGWRLDEVVDLIRGPKNSVVKLEILPAKAKSDTETHIISIVRDKVKLEEQSAQKQTLKVERNGRDFKIGIIDIPAFYADFRAMQRGDSDYRSTTRDVARLLDSLKQEGIDGLVIDLRDNGGGALNEAISLTGLFIPSGPTVQVRASDNRVRVYDDPDNAVAWEGPLVVLVNRMSASASEIFAAAIQDYGRGLIVGDQTFGKGTVQTIRPLNHGQVKLTEAKFYRVSGGSTQHKGVLPDLYLPFNIDKREVGEDALPNALPWDQISSVYHAHYTRWKPVIPILKERHEERLKKDPMFQAVLAEQRWLEAQRDIRTLTLNLNARKAEVEKQQAEQLALINMRRAAQGKPGLKSWDEYEQSQTEQPAHGSRTPAEQDAWLKETGQIIVDFLTDTPQLAGLAPPLTMLE